MSLAAMVSAIASVGAKCDTLLLNPVRYVEVVKQAKRDRKWLRRHRRTALKKRRGW